MKRFGLLSSFAFAATTAGVAGATYLLGLSHSRPTSTQPSTQRAEDGIDDRSREVLGGLAGRVEGARALRVHLSNRFTIRTRHDQRFTSGDYSVVLAKPDKLAIRPDAARTAGKMPDPTVVSDGAELSVSLPANGTYATEPAPRRLGLIPDSTAFAPLGATGNAADVLVALFDERPYERLVEGYARIRYVGDEPIEGTACHRLELVQGQTRLGMWIEAGDRPTIRRLSPDLATRADLPPGTQAELILDFTDWQFDPPLGSDAFAFTPPAGARQADSLTRLAAPPSPLLGKPAPSFDLPLVEGGRASLEKHRGREVVVLDFWATWCIPCVESLPTLTKVVKAYEDKGVVLYGVNRNDDAETVAAFLKEKGLDFKVALDEQSQVSELYDAMGIPKTVIIARDGTVASVHVGYSPNLEKRLTAELDEILTANARTPAARPAESRGVTAPSATQPR